MYPHKKPLTAAVNATAIPCYVADPDPTDRQLIHQALEAEGGLYIVHSSVAFDDVITRSSVIIFIDMRDATMLDHVRRRLLRPGAVLVGVSALPADAVRAFDAGLTDFVVKPCSRVRLSLALVRAKRRLAELERRADSEQPQQAQRVHPLVPPQHASLLGAAVDNGDIYAVFPRGAGARVMGAFGAVNVRMSARSAGAALADQGMIRVHRTTCVSSRHVISLQPLPHGCGEVTLTGGLTVPVAKHRMSSLRAVIRLARDGLGQAHHSTARLLLMGS